MSLSYGALEAADENMSCVSTESTGLLDGSSKKIEKPKPVTLIATIFLLIVASGLVVMAVVWKSPISSVQPTGSFETLTENLVVSTVSNEYGIRDSSIMLPYAFLEGSFLIEPYKETTIALEDPTVGCAYKWYFSCKILGSESASGTSTDGKIIVTLSTVGEYNFIVSEVCSSQSTLHRELGMNVWVKYVRRELSTLTDLDREEFLDAFNTLWTVSTLKGQIIYGDRYKSVNYFATLHNDGGGNPFCDEFHGGLGFLNNHMYLSAYLEQSLQLVNPRVALHYLEYTKYFESASFSNHMKYQLDGGKWTEILSAKFFGANNPSTGEIVDGRWKHQTIPLVTPAFFVEEGINDANTFFPVDQKAWLDKTSAHLNSPYGLLRSPWNYNPSPLLTRYGSVYGINDTTIIGHQRDVVFKYHMGVRCEDYTTFFESVKNQPLETYLFQIEDNTHGIFHFTYGGVGGEQAIATVNTLVKDFNFSYSNIAALTINAQPFFKKYLAVDRPWPVNCTSKPWQNFSMVSSGFPAEIDGPSCDFADEYYVDDDALTGLVDFFFNADPDIDDPVKDHVNSLDFASRKITMRLIANMFPYDGDLAGAGAALDPLFWVAHGAMERMFQKAVFAGIFTDMDYTSSDHCSGHDSEIGKYWLKGFYFANETIAAIDLTNSELTAILDPTSHKYRDLINFVYDTSSYSWCAAADSWFE